ncbi:phage holin [Butyrivibrio proteoclasticus]|uniref:phage holin n=1 Tax=Butyrivibrio proteoclasticus TaxID=43305 RepID=UPI0005501609|nr:phage holin [Butyrivibrio proteoclasticus]
MNEVTFNILKIVVSVVSALVAVYLIPFIKAKTADVKYQKLLDMVEVAVRAAEQTIKGSGQGAAKKEEVIKFVTDWMMEHGVTITYDQLEQLIEAAVFNMKRE